MLLRVFAFVYFRLKSLWYFYSMSSKKKRSPYPFANAKKPSKRKKVSKSFDKDRADVLAASDRGSYFEQEKLISQDEEEQSRWVNEFMKCILSLVRFSHFSFLICTRTCPFVSCPLFMRTLSTCLRHHSTCFVR